MNWIKPLFLVVLLLAHGLSLRAQQQSASQSLTLTVVPAATSNQGSVVGATLASDSFAAGAGPLSGSWTVDQATVDIVTGPFAEVTNSTASTHPYAVYSAASWPNDQWSMVTMKVNGGSALIGPVVRGTTGNNCYYVVDDPRDNLLIVKKFVGGVVTNLSSVSHVLQTGDVVELDAQGTTLTVYLNNVLQMTVTDSSIASGSAGMLGFIVTGSPPSSTSQLLSHWAGGSFSNTPPPIIVSVSPGSASVQVTNTNTFYCAVTNDISNAGCNWTLTGSGCSGATCGTLSTTHTASGANLTYTAPGSVPSPATVTLTAASATDVTKTAAATITVTAAPPPLTVSVSPGTASVRIGLTQTFTPTVVNDGSNLGVDWTLTGSGCSGATCGGVSPAHTASNFVTTYTAPATAPSPATVIIHATSTTDNTKAATATITVITTPYSSTLTWMATGSYPITGYHVKRSTVNGSGYVTVGSVTSGTVTYVDSTVTSGVTYYYVVTAYAPACPSTTFCGESTNSNQVTAVIP